jgi:arylsulfatase A-like enzyme
MRPHELLAATLVGLLAAGCTPAEPELPETRRRVLLLTIDTLRADHLGINGQALDTTPFLDSLLARGWNFRRAIAPLARTTPALASLLTGAYPHTTGVRTLVDPLRDDVATLTERLRARGFATVAVISNHMLTSDRRLDRGFDVYDLASDERDAAGTPDAALARAAALDPDQPTFLWVHYIDPHVPYHPPPELARRFDPGYAGPYALHFGPEQGAIGAAAYPEELGKEGAVYRNELPDAVNAHVRRLYAADIRYTDDQIARLLAGLRERLGETWLVVLTSDHGESLGEHGYYYDHGDYVYDPGLRVPLGFVLPEGDALEGSGSVDQWVSLVDVAPTLAELLGLPLDPDWEGQLEGRSLVPYLRGERLPPQPVFAESGHPYFPGLIERRVRMDVSGRFRTVIDGSHKLIWTPGQEPDRSFELYDLDADPGELRDVAEDEAERVKTLRDALGVWFRAGRTARSAPSAADRERLRSLGYTQ